MRVTLNQGQTLLSPEDAHLLRWTWTTTNNPSAGSRKPCWYVHRKQRTADGRRVTVYLHREIMKPGPGLEVDHKNGNGLDCRRSNMENVTHAENVKRAKARQWENI